MKAILIALLITPFAVQAATLAEYADAHLADQIEARLRRKNCDCTCLNEASTLHKTRVILREDAQLPNLGDEGVRIGALRRKNHCDRQSSGNGTSGGTSGSRDGATPAAFPGNAGNTKMTLPDDISREDFNLAFDKLDPWARMKLNDTAARTPNIPLGAALTTLDKAQKEKFINGLPCAGQESLRDWMARHPEVATFGQPQPIKKH